MRQETRTRAEFGDFQTPLALARDVCAIIKQRGFQPASILEPTCGKGAFIEAALDIFPGATRLVGVDRDREYVQQARAVTSRANRQRDVQVLQGDFFEMDWPSIIATLPKPILIVGNPPWVTNAALGAWNSSNLPEKANLDRLRGIDAVTGKSNFDISEWMLRKNLEWLTGSPGVLAVLCKAAVARKVLFYAWSQNLPIKAAEIRRFDAGAHFGAAVDACLLVVQLGSGSESKDCSDYSTLHAIHPQAVFGLRDGRIVADIRLYDQWRHLLGSGLTGWRSGIKHDCSKVFELVERETEYENGLKVRVHLEPQVVFPLLKSSDLVRDGQPRKWLLVPHRTMASSPEELRRTAPKAWQYLLANAQLLEKRGSSIYRNRPRFSIFGVGEYSFSPWKIAISGLYKRLEFAEVHPFRARPVVLDDTCYFFPCQTEQECRALRELVNSEPARSFWSAFIFWDAKRPITAQILNLLDLRSLADDLGIGSDVARVLAERQIVAYTDGIHQQLLFREDTEEYLADEDGDPV